MKKRLKKFVCKTCGKISVSTASIKTYCSQSCRRIDTKIRLRANALKYYYSNRDNINKKNREKWELNIGGVKDRDREKRIRYQQRTTIGNHIKKIALKTETKSQKSLWDGKGKWARKHDFCEECGLTMYKHSAYGLCTKCYKSSYWKNLPESDKQKIIERNKLYNESRIQNPEFLKKISDKYHDGKLWVSKAVNGELENNPKISNLLKNIKI